MENRYVSKLKRILFSFYRRAIISLLLNFTTIMLLVAIIAGFGGTTMTFERHIELINGIKKLYIQGYYVFFVLFCCLQCPIKKIYTQQNETLNFHQRSKHAQLGPTIHDLMKESCHHPPRPTYVA